jgi:hypothetical protein
MSLAERLVEKYRFIRWNGSKFEDDPRIAEVVDEALEEAAKELESQPNMITNYRAALIVRGMKSGQ